MKKIVPILLIILCFSACKKSETDNPSESHQFSAYEIQQADTLSQYFKILVSDGNNPLDTADLYFGGFTVLGQSLYYLSSDSIIAGFTRSTGFYTLQFFKHISKTDIDTATYLFYSANYLYNYFASTSWNVYKDQNDLKIYPAIILIKVVYKGMTFTYDEKYDSQLQFDVYDVELDNSSNVVVYGRFSGRLYNVLGDPITVEDAIFKVSFNEFY